MIRRQYLGACILVLAILALSCDRVKDPPTGNSMTLQVNGNVVSRNPDARLISESLAGLDVDRDAEGLAILARDEMTYVQVSGDSKRGFDAEYQTGSIDQHYRADNESFSLDEVTVLRP